MAVTTPNRPPPRTVGPPSPRPRAKAPLAAVPLGLWFTLPLVPLLLWAVADRWTAPAVLPQVWGLRGWRSALREGALTALGHSLLLGLVVAALATCAGALAGRSLVLGRVPAPRLVTVLLLAPVAVPGFALAVGLDAVLLRARVPGPVGVVLVLTVAALPYTTWVMRVAYGGYDLGFEDEARTLGATARQVVLRVQLPLLAPALSGAAFLAFLVAWSDYVVTLLVGGGQLVTVPLLVASTAAAVGNEPEVAALSLSGLLPPLALLLVLRRVRRGVA